VTRFGAGRGEALLAPHGDSPVRVVVVDELQKQLATNVK
jgi:hypothetical protein